MAKSNVSEKVAKLREEKIYKFIVSLQKNTKVLHRESTSNTVEHPTRGNAPLSESQTDLISKLTESTQALSESGVIVSNQQYPFGTA